MTSLCTLTMVATPYDGTCFSVGCSWHDVLRLGMGHREYNGIPFPQVTIPFAHYRSAASGNNRFCRIHALIHSFLTIGTAFPRDLMYALMARWLEPPKARTQPHEATVLA